MDSEADLKESADIENGIDAFLLLSLKVVGCNREDNLPSALEVKDAIKQGLNRNQLHTTV